MPENLAWLLSSAVSIGFIHTLLGPDHYLPFIALARAREWTRRRTLIVTILCGIGHVGSSVVIGLVGIGLGVATVRLEWFETSRGVLAGWFLLAFGLVYLVWGVRRAIRNRPHVHLHVHADGTVHRHEHVHTGQHLHVHVPPYAPIGGDGRFAEPGRPSITPWVLFLVFVFGPCEPLIPLLMFAAATGRGWTVAGVSLVYGAATLAAMLIMVLGGQRLIAAMRLRRLERFGHAAAGFVLSLCGICILSGL